MKRAALAASTILCLSAPAMADTAKKVYDFNHTIGAEGSAGQFSYAQHADMMKFAGIKILGDAVDTNPAALDPVMNSAPDIRLVVLTSYSVTGTATTINQLKALNTRWGPNGLWVF